MLSVGSPGTLAEADDLQNSLHHVSPVKEIKKRAIRKQLRTRKCLISKV